MDISIQHNRGSESALAGSTPWRQIQTIARRIQRSSFIGRQTGGGRTLAKGGQRALNSLLDEAFEAAGWIPGTRLFRQTSSRPPWQVAFTKGEVAVVVCTHNVGYLPQRQMILEIAAGGDRPDRNTRAAAKVGVLMIPTDELKSWSRMDSAVATYQEALEHDAAVGPLLSAPTAIVGLDARSDGTVWESTDVFPGGR